MLHTAQGRTVALIRHLRSMPLHQRVRRAGRIPRALQPDALRLDYYRAIHPICDLARREFAREEGEILHLLKALRRRQGKMDADDGKRATHLIDAAARRLTEAVKTTELHQVAKEFGRRTSAFQRGQLDRQVQAAIGVPLSSIEKPTRDRIEGFAATNVDLIVTVPDRYFDRIRLDVEGAFAGGTHPDTLARQLAERFDMAEDDARRIARDQIGKLNAQVNQDRQESLGVTGYAWRTMNDQRVRDEHQEREGQHFEWDDPPDDGHPGEAVQCRCYGDPDLQSLLEATAE